MLRTTTVPQPAAGQPGLTRREAALKQTLARADEAAAAHDYASALAWLTAIEAIDRPLPREYTRKRAAWVLAERGE
jgi:hypothetical protein